MINALLNRRFESVIVNMNKNRYFGTKELNGWKPSLRSQAFPSTSFPWGSQNISLNNWELNNEYCNH